MVVRKTARDLQGHVSGPVSRHVRHEAYQNFLPMILLFLSYQKGFVLCAIVVCSIPFIQI